MLPPGITKAHVDTLVARMRREDTFRRIERMILGATEDQSRTAADDEELVALILQSVREALEQSLANAKATRGQA